jgi:hypothetical protein
MTATIKAEDNGDLSVECSGYSYRRIAGTWQMQSNTGAWFECNISDPRVQRQVDDFEYCLRPYAFEEGPPPPKTRSSDVSESVRQLQRKELYAATKNIFAPVALKYSGPRAPTSISRLLKKSDYLSRHLTK